MSKAIITCDNLVKIYKVADLEVVALQGLDLEVSPGEMLAIVGVSGSGKSTLLNILGGLDTPSAGRCLVNGHDLTRLSEAQRIRYRRLIVGHIWQQSGRNLLPELSIAANVELPQLLGGVGASQRRKRARELLELVGLGDKGKNMPNQLSGGEQQRVALARALVHEPRFIVADEPTGNLDSVTARDIAQLLQTIAHQSQIGLLVATHDVTVVAAADRILQLHDGRIVEAAPV